MQVGTIIRDKKYLTRFLIGFFIIIFYVGVSLSNQIRYIFTPFSKSYQHIPYMLSKDDLGQLKELSPPIYQLIEEVNKYPEDARFYFIPCFKDSGNTLTWSWYLYLLMRYLSYPRKVFCIHPRIYGDDKTEYMERFIKDRKSYKDLEWIKVNDINYVILFRNNRISVLPVDSKIRL